MAFSCFACDPGVSTALKTNPCWRTSNKPGVSNPAASLHQGPSQTSDPKRQTSCLEAMVWAPSSLGRRARDKPGQRKKRKKTPHALPIDLTRRQPTAVAVICTPPFAAAPLVWPCLRIRAHGGYQGCQEGLLSGSKLRKSSYRWSDEDNASRVN